MKNRNKLYLTDIIESINKIETYTKGIDYDSFCFNEMMVDAVIRNLEIIGEASKNVSDEIKLKYPEVPWKQMTGVRNILIHEYFGVDGINNLGNRYKGFTRNKTVDFESNSGRRELHITIHSRIEPYGCSVAERHFEEADSGDNPARLSGEAHRTNLIYPRSSLESMCLQVENA